MIWICGQGAGCEGILEVVLMLGEKVQVFTHPGALGERIYMQAAKAGMPATFGSVNDPDVYAYNLPPSLIVSCGYLTILRGDTLKRPAINCHYALLPRHRGRSAVPWAIIEGDDLTGVSWHWMTAGIDEGNLLIQATCPIDPGETQLSLFDKLHVLAAETAPAAIRLARGGWAGIRQRGRAQNHPPGPPHGGAINPQWRDDYIERFVRAMTLPPLPYASYKGHEVRTMDDFYTIAQEDAEAELVL